MTSCRYLSHILTLFILLQYGILMQRNRIELHFGENFDNIYKFDILQQVKQSTLKGRLIQKKLSM